MREHVCVHVWVHVRVHVCARTVCALSLTSCHRNFFGREGARLPPKKIAASKRPTAVAKVQASKMLETLPQLGSLAIERSEIAFTVARALPQGTFLLASASAAQQKVACGKSPAL